MTRRWLFLPCLPLLLLSALALPGQKLDQRTLGTYLEWERWQKAQSPGESWDRDGRLSRYRTKLEEDGIRPQAAAGIVAALGRRLDADEASFWNRLYSSARPRFNTKPNQLLARAVQERDPGKALDVEMGQGRNAVFLAQQGWAVTGFDLSSKALEIAQQQAQEAGVEIRAVLAKDQDFDFGTEQWDLIALLYVMEKRSLVRTRNALKPGGLVVVEGFHQDMQGPSVRYASEELLARFAGFRILHCEEVVDTADWGNRKVRLVKLVAQKPL
jgi:2-polyprenyl-3-methyl-5-hydroxy-6-metoxy-1,4-benzoquinol methylase